MISRCWDDQCVVYDCESGNTHLLSRPFAQILEKLRREESIESIVSFVFERNLAEDLRSAQELVESASREFRQLRLIR